MTRNKDPMSHHANGSHVLRALGLGLLALASAMAGCRHRGERSDVIRPPALEEKKDDRDPTSTTTRGPQTIEENEPVVVDEQGNKTPLTQRPDEIKAQVSANCPGHPCFVIKEWSLIRGETYIRIQEDGKLLTLRETGFDNTDLSGEQKTCLAETARALKTYATANPGAMQPFAAAGVTTAFVARLYDTTAVPDDVSPSLYFVYGGDGSKTKENLAKGKWIIRSAINNNTPTEPCQIPSQSSIADRLAYFSKALLAPSQP